MTHETRNKIFKYGGITVLALALLILVGLLLENRGDSNEDDLILSASDEELYYQDTDADGIPDWEEILLGYDPLKVDTDDDGLTDNQSYTLAKEALAEAAKELPIASQTELENLSVTDRIGRQTYARVAILESAGELTPEKEAEIQQEIYQELLNGDAYDTIDAYNLRLTPRPDTLSKANYMNETATILATIVFNDPNPVILLDNAIEQDKPRIVEEGFIDQIELIKEAKAKMLAVQVDPTYVEPHITIVNLLDRVEKDMEQIQNYFNDPLLGYAASVKYRSNGVSLMQEMRNISLRFIEEVEQELAASN